MTATKIRQSELMQRLKMLPRDIVQFRETYLKRDADWWKEGTVIYWTEEAAQRLDCSLKGLVPSGSVTSENIEGMDGPVKVHNRFPDSNIIELFIAKACPNPRFVIGDMNGIKVPVQCHPKFSKNIVRKTVKVRVTRNGEETIYQYER